MPNKKIRKLITKALFTTVTNVNFNEESIKSLITEVRAEKNNLVPQCTLCASPCGNNDEYDISKI